MTDLKTADRADSGEIVPLSVLMDSYVPELDRHRTRNLSGRRALPPTQALRLDDAQPVGAHAVTDYWWLLPTGAELAVASRPIPPTVPSPSAGTPPGPNPPPGPPPPVRPRSHRRRWSPLARRALRCWVAVAVVELAALAAVVALAMS